MGKGYSNRGKVENLSLFLSYGDDGLHSPRI